MSQNWVADLYTTGTVGDTTLSNMELMFATLRSSFSGAGAPSNVIDGNLWYDTDTDLLKLYRNAAWVGVLAGSASFKIWVYRNTAEDGWSIDATVTDRVLALKGGSEAYNVSGGGVAGSWTLSGLLASSHSHGNGSLAGASHTHSISHPTGGDGQIANGDNYSDTPRDNTINTGGSGLNVTGSTGATQPTISHNGDDRPAAAVGTLQYPNLT